MICFTIATENGKDLMEVLRILSLYEVTTKIKQHEARNCNVRRFPGFLFIVPEHSNISNYRTCELAFLYFRQTWGQF